MKIKTKYPVFIEKLVKIILNSWDDPEAFEFIDDCDSPSIISDKFDIEICDDRSLGHHQVKISDCWFDVTADLYGDDMMSLLKSLFENVRYYSMIEYDDGLEMFLKVDAND